MFNDFSHRHTSCIVDGQPERVILSRDSKSTSMVSREYMYNAVFAPDSQAREGSMFQADGQSYLVQTLRKTVERDLYCSAVRTNAQVTVQRYMQSFDAADNPIGGPSFVDVDAGYGFVSMVSARMRQEDPGILKTTTHILQVQSSLDVKQPEEVRSPDRIVMSGRPYCVDAVDTFKLPNIFVLQLSGDVR